MSTTTQFFHLLRLKKTKRQHKTNPQGYFNFTCKCCGIVNLLNNVNSLLAIYSCQVTRWPNLVGGACVLALRGKKWREKWEKALCLAQNGMMALSWFMNMNMLTSWCCKLFSDIRRLCFHAVGCNDTEAIGELHMLLWSSAQWAQAGIKTC